MPSPNTGFTAIAAGNAYSLGLKADGSIVGWGYNTNGQCNVPSPNTDFTAIAAGPYHILGLKADGSIVGWGCNGCGEVNVPPPNAGFVAVAAGDRHSLGLQTYGSLQVTIEPAGAVAAGAQWRRVGTATWFDSGHIESGIPTGDYTVEFKVIASWDAPPSRNVTILKGSTTTQIATYVRHTGSVRVTIVPAGAVADGAQWSVDGGTTWRDSATSLTVATGNYTVTFKEITHWLTPASLAVTVTKDQLLERTGTYTAVGSLQVTIQPAQALAAGAQWSVDGGATWHPSGTRLVLAIGPRTVRFKAVAGRVTPSDRSVVIEHRQTSETAVYYNAPPVTQPSIVPPQPGTLDTIQAIATASDADGHAIVAYQYQWLRGGNLVTTETILSDDLTTKSQQWQLRARARDSVGDWGEWGAVAFTIANTPPTQPVVEIRPQAPTPDRDLIVDIIEYSQDPDGDAIGYDFQWFLSRDLGQTWIHKAELDGSSQVSNEYILGGDLWRVKVTPYEKPVTPGAVTSRQEKAGEVRPMARVEGTPGWYQVYVGQNNPPQLQFTRLVGTREGGGAVRLQIAWTWRDDDGEACTVLLFWTDRGSYGLHPISGTLPAEQGGHVAVAPIAAGVPVHVYAIITDAKGAMTQVTSSQIEIKDSQPAAADPAWMLFE